MAELEMTIQLLASFMDQAKLTDSITIFNGKSIHTHNMSRLGHG